MIKSLLPDLVTAISDRVQPVSDQCLAKGLIPDSVYKRVLESRGTSEDKAECEHGIEAICIKTRIKELAHTIEEQGMKVKRGRIIAELKTEKMLATSLDKAKEEMRAKERDLAAIIQEKFENRGVRA